MGCEHKSRTTYPTVDGGSIAICDEEGCGGILMWLEGDEPMWRLPRNAARLDKLLEVVKAWRYGGMSTAVFCTAVDDLAGGPDVHVKGCTCDKCKPVASSRPCPSCGGDNDSSIGCGMCGGSGRVENGKPGDAPTTDTLRVMEVYDRVLSELKARVDDLETNVADIVRNLAEEHQEAVAHDDAAEVEAVAKSAMRLRRSMGNDFRQWWPVFQADVDALIARRAEKGT